MDKEIIKILIKGAILVVVVSFAIRYVDKLFNPDIPPTTTSEVVSEYVSGVVTTKAEVKNDGTVEVRSNEVELTALQDIRKGDKFTVDLGIHTVSRAVEYSPVTAWFGATSHGLAAGLSLNEKFFGKVTYGMFLGLMYASHDDSIAPFCLGLNLGYYWDINKHTFIGYDIVNKSGSIGVGVRW